MWIGILFHIISIAVSIIGVVKAVRSRFTDIDAAIICWIAVPISWIGTILLILL